MFWFLVSLFVIGFLFFLYWKYFKRLKLKSIVFVDGTLGTGKSFLSVSLAVRKYKSNLFKYKIKKGILRFLNVFNRKFGQRAKLIEKPLLYSNIKLRNIDFVVVTKDLLCRENYRFAKSSVLLLDEFSLVADQMMFKDRYVNERLSEFFKLFRHEVGKDSLIVINSQSTSDLHYSLKYVLSDFIYIHSRSRLPFCSLLKVEEVSYSADKGVTLETTNDGDIENNLLNLLVWNKYFKYYDSYCYSIFTDSLPVYKKVVRFGKKDSLKADVLVSFKAMEGLYRNWKTEQDPCEKMEHDPCEKKEIENEKN